MNSRSPAGIYVDVLKSALQKYLRRRELEKMVWCMEELYLFAILGKTDSQRRIGKAIVSNLLGRIVVMLDEELLFMEVERYLLIREYLEKFEKSDRADLIYLKIVCEIMIDGRLCRRNSYGRSFWCHRLEGEDEIERDDEEYFLNFKDCFENGREEWAVWMFKILHGGKSDGVKRFRREENVYKIWEYLFSLEKVKQNEKIKKVLEYKLREFHKKDRKERFIFLYSSVDICMYYNGEWENLREKYDKDVRILKDLYTLDEIDLETREGIEVNDYVYDIHTTLGKTMGRNKEHFKKEGCFVLNEDGEFLREEWKDFYVNFFGSGKEKKEKKEKKELKEKEKKEKKELKEKEKKEKKELKEKEKKELKEKEKKEKKELKEKEKKEKKELKEKEKKEKKEKMNFDFVKNKELLEIDENKISLCCDVVCGNKVMCFEYNGKIYKEGRKSMNYNLDYLVFDMCKELFGLNCIGMELRLGKFRIVKKDKNVLSYKDNWEVEKTEEDVVYTVMEKIGNCEMLIERKNEVVKNARWLKEYCRIGMVRGIFRVSDFNMRNVLIDGNGELVSIDENDILGKRKDIFGMKNRVVLKELKKNENLLMELLQEIWEVDFDAVEEIVKKFGFDGEKIRENWMNLEEDVRKELNF
jgi:flagellar biosynthesis GTPase FlhF